MTRAKWLIGSVLVLLAQLAVAQIPQTISYQGVLRDANGNVVANDDYDILFTLYDVNDNEVWSEWHSGVPAGNPVTVTDGVFSVILGKETPFTTITETPFWLGIKIGAGAELPRIELTSVIYALHADRSDSSNYAQKAGEVSGTGNVFPSSGFVGIGTTNPENALHVKGWFKLEGSDFLMGDPAKGDGGRALVHAGSGDGTDDMLILNHWGDFEEGIVVEGSRLTVEGNLIANSYVGIGTATPAYPLEVVGGIKADSIKIAATMRYYSIQAAAFASVRVPYLIQTVTGGTFYEYYTPVNLPHDAVIKELTAYVYDASSSENISIDLKAAYQHDLSWTSLASMTSTGLGGNEVVSLTEMGDGLSETVNNYDYAYVIRVHWTTDMAVPGNIMFMNLRIGYTITTPLP